METCDQRLVRDIARLWRARNEGLVKPSGVPVQGLQRSKKWRPSLPEWEAHKTRHRADEAVVPQPNEVAGEFADDEDFKTMRHVTYLALTQPDCFAALLADLDASLSDLNEGLKACSITRGDVAKAARSLERARNEVEARRREVVSREAARNAIFRELKDRRTAHWTARFVEEDWAYLFPLARVGCSDLETADR